jgi:hypothetical protein
MRKLATARSTSTRSTDTGHCFWSEPACPGGCQFEVGAPADVLIGRAVTLANDPDADEDTFILTDIAPARL